MTILIAFLVFTLAVLFLSLGVLFSGRRIQGSCGGLSNIPGIESDCGGLCRAKGDKLRKERCHRRSESRADDYRARPDLPRQEIRNGNTP